MSDNSIPTSADGQQQTPPAAPIASAPPAPPAPSAQPYQAYPGAAPSVAPPQGYATQSPQPPQYAPQQPYGSAVAQPYGAPAQPPYYGSSAPGQPGAGYATNYGATPYPAPRPSSGLAITSLICGIAGIVLFWAVVPLLASIVAVITGHMALRQTKQNPAIGGRGMAFAGLIMGYIMVAVLVIGIVMTVISALFFGAFTLPFLFSA